MIPNVQNKSRSYYKIILTYITIFIVLLLTLASVILFFNYDNYVLSRLYSYTKENLSQVRYNAELMFESADTLSKQVFLDSTVNTLMYTVDDDFGAMIALNNLLNYVSSNSNLESIYIYNTNQGKVSYAIRNAGSGIQNYNTFFDNDILKNISAHKSGISKSPISRVIGKSDKYPPVKEANVYTFILVENSNNSNAVDGAIVLNFSADKLYKAISFLDKSPRSTTFVIDKNGVVVSNNSALHFLDDISDKDYIKKILSSMEGSSYFVADINGSKTLITYVSSNKLNWNFIKITPYYTEISGLKRIRTISLIAYICTIILGIFMSILISKRLYKPYNSMSDRIKELDIQSRDSFYCYKQDFLQNLLYNSDSFSYQVLLQKFKEFNIELSEGKALTVILFKIDHYSDFCNKYNFTDRNLLKFGITNIASEICRAHCKNETVVTNSDHVVLIACTDDMQSIQGISQIISESVLKFLEISCSIIISSTSDSTEHLTKMYNEALETSYYRIFLGHRCTILYNEKVLAKKTGFIYPERKINQLLDFVMLGRIDTAKKLYAEFLDSLQGYDYNTFIQALTRLCLEFCHTTSTLEKNNNFLIELNFNDFISALNKFETVEDINRIFYNYFDEIAENLNKKKDSKHDKFIENVIKIINEEFYDPNLSINSISDKLKVSSSHLRHVFKQFTNKSISDYINEVRIDNAKDLLKTTSLPVSDICNKTGFINGSYFFTLFKKINGVTPTEYRQS